MFTMKIFGVINTIVGIFVCVFVFGFKGRFFEGFETFWIKKTRKRVDIGCPGGGWGEEGGLSSTMLTNLGTLP